MADITYDQIIIAGIHYSSLLNLEITSRLNTHAEAVITFEVTEEESRAIEVGVSDESYVVVSADNPDGYKTLFVGIKYSYSCTNQAGYRVGTLILKSTSYLLDKEKKSRSFQRTTVFKSALIEEVVAGRAIINYNITDSPTFGLYIQKNETDWNFLVRIAEAGIIPNYTTEKPIIDIGRPLNDNVKGIGGLMVNSQVPSYITFTSSMFHNGVLETTSVSQGEEAFQKEKIPNEELAGRMLSGIVQNVEKEKVQVFFDEIDEEYDSDGDTWFEYAAAYSGPGGTYGSGFYFMPEVGDRVRVFFPSGKESEGFAFASEMGYTLDDPTKISWRAPGGQELLFTENGIRITGKQGSIYIDMQENDSAEFGIEMYCNTNIQFSTHKGGTVQSDLPEIYVYGKEGVNMTADNQILFETPETTLEIDRDKIILNANQVYIN